jgi:hypothetical protein
MTLLYSIYVLQGNPRTNKVRQSHRLSQYVDFQRKMGRVESVVVDFLLSFDFRPPSPPILGGEEFKGYITIEEVTVGNINPIGFLVDEQPINRCRLGYNTGITLNNESLSHQHLQDYDSRCSPSHQPPGTY